MISLHKPNDPPRALVTRAQPATQQNCDAYLQDPAAYDSGKLKFRFTASIYRSTTIKEVLKKQQYNKCCYCESKHSATSAGRIDHFRPKSAIRQCKGSTRIYPGYYWLAYSWDNLPLACDQCNLKKSDYFPLKEPRQRARSPLDPLDQEAPLLLNPYVEPNPAKHLTFDGSACRPQTERGRATIAVLGLNRPELQEERQYVLTMLTLLCSVARHPDRPPAVRRGARDAMQSYAQPGARYTAMARRYLNRIHAESEDRT